jgi:hypothetical protein
LEKGAFSTAHNISALPVLMLPVLPASPPFYLRTPPSPCATSPSAR